MAKVIIEKWQCDWCKEIHDKKPDLYYPRCTISYTYMWDWSDENKSIIDICPKCNDKLKKLIDENFRGKS